MFTSKKRGPTENFDQNAMNDAEIFQREEVEY